VIDHIELAMPARAELLQLARMTAGVVASRAQLGFEDVEDLRLSVEELCLTLVGPTGDGRGRLVLDYRWDATVIEITCTVIPDDNPTDDVPGDGDAGRDEERLRRELSSQILDALVDEHGETDENGHRAAWLRMRRTDTGRA
jgi:hypothetical protein